MHNNLDNCIETMPLYKVIEKYPYIQEFFLTLGIKNLNINSSINQLISNFTDTNLQDLGISREKILNNFILFIENFNKLTKENENKIASVTIVGGYNKLGEKENTKLILKPGEIVSIVGPTGSGKSRLLGDIECLAQKDTPSKRQILINGKTPDEDQRFSVENNLIAQLSQNMNFVMDVTVSEFITMHAESRMINNIEKTVKLILQCANELAGEVFSNTVPITQLSGGQSRALMIADTALLSKSPIVLIDEIENAGVDRKKALELLVKKEKIVLMSTHDPILALMGDKRIVIKNGGIDKIIQTDNVEKINLEVLSKFDNKILNLRNMLRTGKKIDFDINHYLSDKS
ncbi:ATP-binding cassette domain-containing protein [Clostridium magnum]|uniref:ABC transporter ATP-binding protein YxdL n=1 Tax=Clostridium magnum DSM 2767 TaxID=1121326 RepID=A0A165RZU5_9CLOT|nr:ATP-binding cassette domain-containing protein [Clostridium magnum]KZL91423.1 ABC transporter ATP-binding protein YxdL [Clostridium magnum DSM 2767]SHH41836.1 ABC-type lipoprotein export system, ATPase component [Clostridium magnum DSM 2767]